MDQRPSGSQVHSVRIHSTPAPVNAWPSRTPPASTLSSFGIGTDPYLMLERRAGYRAFSSHAGRDESGHGAVDPCGGVLMSDDFLERLPEPPEPETFEPPIWQ